MQIKGTGRVFFFFFLFHDRGELQQTATSCISMTLSHKIKAIFLICCTNVIFRSFH